MKPVTIVGAGLAGCEAGLAVARAGLRVRLLEMRPCVMTEAHTTGDVAELVCSNSFKSDEPANAHGLLKAELRVLGSRLLGCAERARIPGGKALVVDRRRFSAEVQAELDQAGVGVERGEVTELPEGIVIVAAGPLASAGLALELARVLGRGRLFFYDATAPIVAAESIDKGIAFAASRYGAGEDYLNCPLDESGYNRFVDALLGAELHPLHEFETADGGLGHGPGSEDGSGSCPAPAFFEGCLPLEEIARRGRMALAFGPAKPVGLVDPRTGKRPFAVVQLRRENAEGTMFNLVGFQTRLRHGEQERVFRMIPGLAQARFLRYGSMHRNTFIDSPRCLLPTLQARVRLDLLVAGQLTGVEGYVESIGAGMLAGINAARLAKGQEPVVMPDVTMLGGLVRHITQQRGHDPGSEDRSGSCPPSGFQPMNANFGLLPAPLGRLRGTERRQRMGERALAAMRETCKS